MWIIIIIKIKNIFFYVFHCALKIVIFLLKNNNNWIKNKKNKKIYIIKKKKRKKKGVLGSKKRSLLVSHSIIQWTFHIRIKHIIISQNSAFVCTLCFCFEWICLDLCFNKLLIILELFRWCLGFLGRVEYAISDSESVCLHFEVWWSHPMRRCETSRGKLEKVVRCHILNELYFLMCCIIY